MSIPSSFQPGSISAYLTECAGSSYHRTSTNILFMSVIALPLLDEWLRQSIQIIVTNLESPSSPFVLQSGCFHLGVPGCEVTTSQHEKPCWPGISKRYHNEYSTVFSTVRHGGALSLILMSLITFSALVSLVRGGDANLQEYFRHMDLISPPFAIAVLQYAIQAESHKPDCVDCLPHRRTQPR